MLDGLLVAELLPFTIALGVMLLIALTEASGMLFGISPAGLIDQLLPEYDFAIDGDMDVDLDGDADVTSGEAPGEAPGLLSRVLGWLCVGRVPLLVLFVAFLTVFGLGGIVLQSTSQSIIGFYLPTWVGAVGTLFLSLPPTRWFALGLSRVMPKEETDAVSSETFIGRVAIIFQGLARADLAAQAKLKDEKGLTHYVRVVPDKGQPDFPQGTKVLIVRRSGPGVFFAIISNNEFLS